MRKELGKTWVQGEREAETRSFLHRFHLPQRTVCGGSKDEWVIKLVSCFDHKGESFAPSPQLSPGLRGPHLSIFFASSISLVTVHIPILSLAKVLSLKSLFTKHHSPLLS